MSHAIAVIVGMMVGGLLVIGTLYWLALHDPPDVG